MYIILILLLFKLNHKQVYEQEWATPNKNQSKRIHFPLLKKLTCTTLAKSMFIMSVLYQCKDSKINKQLFRKQFNFLLEGETRHEFLQSIKKFNTRSKHLVQLIYLIEAVQNTNQICNEINKIIAYFEYFPLTLKILIEQRQSKNQQFSQSQIWKFFTDLLIVQIELNKNDNYHGDISPQFIYYDKNLDILKLFDPVFFNTMKSGNRFYYRKQGYHRALLQPSYLSPEILINLSEKRALPQFNPYKSDIFSIGMVILYCASMTDPIIAYDIKKFEIDFYHLENLLRIAKKKYSERLISTIRKALIEKNRPSAKQLLEQINNTSIQSFSRDDSDRTSHTGGISKKRLI